MAGHMPHFPKRQKWLWPTLAVLSLATNDFSSSVRLIHRQAART